MAEIEPPGELAVLRMALEEVQWSGRIAGEADAVCPICEEAAWTQAHHAHCAIGKALTYGAGKAEELVIFYAQKAAQVYRDAVNGTITNMTMLDAWEQALKELSRVVEDMKKKKKKRRTIVGKHDE